MTNEITTEVKTHVVITRSNLHIYITQKQYDGILERSSEADGRGGIPLKTQQGAETYVSFGDIASMTDMETYFTNFPDKRPDPVSMVKSVFNGAEELPAPRATKTIRQHAEEYLAANPDEDSAKTRFMRQALNFKIGSKAPKRELKYKTWQEYYYDHPEELLANKTKDQILEFLKEAPAGQLEKMKEIMTAIVEKHDPCDCPEVGVCRPSGLLAAMIGAEKRPAPTVDKPVKATVKKRQ